MSCAHIQLFTHLVSFTSGRKLRTFFVTFFHHFCHLEVATALQAPAAWLGSTVAEPVAMRSNVAWMWPMVAEPIALQVQVALLWTLVTGLTTMQVHDPHGSGARNLARA